MSRLAAALVVASAAVAVVGACGEDADVTTPQSDGGAESGTVERAACPSVANAPVEGASCTLPEGTTCDFGECGRNLAQCTRGAWRYGSNATSKPPCPETPPAEGTPCPPCWPEDLACRYGSTNCALEDASVNTATASCPKGPSASGPIRVWVIDIRPCRDGGEPDVQGDADAAAD